MKTHWLGGLVTLCAVLLVAGLAAPAQAQITDAQLQAQCSAQAQLPAGWTYKTQFLTWADVQWSVQNPFPGKVPGEVSTELMVSAAAVFQCRPDLNGSNPQNLPSFDIPATPRGTAYLQDIQVCANQGGVSKMTIAFVGAACPFTNIPGFPAVSSYSANGPYSVKGYNIVNGPACSFYGPDPATFNLRAPVVLFGIESGNTVEQYSGVFVHMASHGFVVIASHTASPSPSALSACLTSLFNVNDSQGDPFYRKLNPNLIATAGHGFASGAAMFVASQDSRVGTTVAYQPSLVSSAPAGYVSSTAVITELAEGRFFGQGIYDGSPSPSVYVEDQTNSGSLNQRKQAIGLAFLRWRMMQDATAGNMFNQSCSLCTDPAYRVQRK